MSGFVVQGESSQGLGFNVWGLVYCIACGVWSDVRLTGGFRGTRVGFRVQGLNGLACCFLLPLST